MGSSTSRLFSSSVKMQFSRKKKPWSGGVLMGSHIPYFHDSSAACEKPTFPAASVDVDAVEDISHGVADGSDARETSEPW